MMLVNAFLHTHVAVVVLFLLLFGYKTMLLLLNKRAALEQARKKTQLADMILGTLILVTGAWMIFNYNGETPVWLIVKIVLVLLAIPVGITGIRKENKILTVAALLVFIYTYSIAQTDSLIMQPSTSDTEIPAITETPETDAAETGIVSQTSLVSAQDEIVAAMDATALDNAKAVYTQLCTSCHGQDGRKGAGGAADLAVSNYSLIDRITVIDKGRGLMPAFGKQLTAQETEALAAYTMTLKK
jgi:mono/diheme cytochrome c family protein/uncharacterized membrane protein SirB2